MHYFPGLEDPGRFKRARPHFKPRPRKPRRKKRKKEKDEGDGVLRNNQVVKEKKLHRNDVGDAYDHGDRKEGKK